MTTDRTADTYLLRAGFRCHRSVGLGKHEAPSSLSMAVPNISISQFNHSLQAVHLSCFLRSQGMQSAR